MRDHVQSSMSDDEQHSQVLGALPRTRPHRRSDKRGARPAGAEQPAGAPNGGRRADAPNGDAPAKAKPRRKAAAATQQPAKRAAKPRAASKPAANGREAGSSARSPKPSQVEPIRPTTARSGSGRLRQPAQPEGTPEARRGRRPAPPSGPDILGTAVQAAAELTEIGLTASARAIRRAVSRLPRP
jgi:hypothetical protein